MIDFEKLSDVIDIDDGNVTTYGLHLRQIRPYNTWVYVYEDVNTVHLCICVDTENTVMSVTIVHQPTHYTEYNEVIDFQKLVLDLDNHLRELVNFAKNYKNKDERYKIAKNDLEGAIKILNILERIKAKSEIDKK